MSRRYFTIYKQMRETQSTQSAIQALCSSSLSITLRISNIYFIKERERERKGGGKGERERGAGCPVGGQQVLLMTSTMQESLLEPGQTLRNNSGETSQENSSLLFYVKSQKHSNGIQQALRIPVTNTAHILDLVVHMTIRCRHCRTFHL